jgi:hypothetical protein
VNCRNVLPLGCLDHEWTAATTVSLGIWLAGADVSPDQAICKPAGGLDRPLATGANGPPMARLHHRLLPKSSVPPSGAVSQTSYDSAATCSNEGPASNWAHPWGMIKRRRRGTRLPEHVPDPLVQRRCAVTAAPDHRPAAPAAPPGRAATRSPRNEIIPKASGGERTSFTRH